MSSSASMDVRDAVTNRAKFIGEAVRALGKSQPRIALFEAIYFHKKAIKTVPELAEKTRLTRKQVLELGIQLVRPRLVEQLKVDGQTAYRQIDFYQHHKKQILSLVKNPKRYKEFLAEQQPVLSFEHRHAASPKARSNARSKTRRIAVALKIAFLTTNPDPKAALRTDIEARGVLRALKSAGLREKVELKVLPAATANDLVDALNDFAPTIVHFGGHGGNEGLLFDDESNEGEGGVDIDFALINKILAATDTKPTMVVFNACDTLHGAGVFLGTVSAVVAMSDSIGDLSAAVFAAAFYRALASGQSVATALQQGKNAIEIAQLGDFDLPTPLVRTGLDLSSMVLVK